MDRLKVLAALSACIGIAVQAIKTNTLNTALDRYGIRQIHKEYLPRISLALGLAAGVIEALMTNADIWAAIPKLIDGLVIGAMPVAAHEAFRRKATPAELPPSVTPADEKDSNAVS